MDSIASSCRGQQPGTMDPCFEPQPDRFGSWIEPRRSNWTIAPGSAHRGKDAMTPTRPTARSGGYLPFLLLFLSLGCLTWAFWPTLTELFHTWWSDPQYSHGFLVW